MSRIPLKNHEKLSNEPRPPHLYTEDEYVAMADTVQRMTRGGIPLL